MGGGVRVFASRKFETNLEGHHMPGKDRPRFGGGKTYSTPRNKAFEKRIGDEYRLRNGSEFADWRGPVRLTVTYQNPCPRSVKEGKADTTKPDVDNVAKLVMDALTGVAWRDDKQVTRLCVEKFPRFARKSVYLGIEIEYMEVSE